MKCPYCTAVETKVTDKRDSGALTRRRRECLKCNKRFTTYERVEFDLAIIKKNGRREQFDRDKLRYGIEKAFEKLDVSSNNLDAIVDDIVAKVRRVAKDKDILSSQVGDIVMNKLKKVDKVAYIRFAAVYREFADIEEFNEEIKKLK
ncbi:transcriptional repressor NrdR [archaeon]|jgi:transcriptional repressor NrdR|nr:transcriptional repressor NrdR [archaeon]